MNENDKVWFGGFIGFSLLIPVIFALSNGLSWWYVLLGLALLANTAIMGLRLQARREWLRSSTRMAPIPVRPPESSNDRALAATQRLLDELFPNLKEVREMFALDLAKAAEETGNHEYGQRLRNMIEISADDEAPRR